MDPLTKIGFLLDRFVETLKSASQAIELLGNTIAAKILILGLVVAFALYFYRRYLIKPTFERSDEDGRSPLVNRGLISLYAIGGVILGIAMIPSVPKNDPIRQYPPEENRQGHEPHSIVPGQLTCADGSCGLGGPAVDPKEYPNNLRQEDLEQYLKSEAGLSKIPTVCTVFGRANSSSRALFDIKVRLPSGGTCERFFEATSTVTELSLLKPPAHGNISVKNRSFKYSSVSGYRGSDIFLLKQCSLTQDLTKQLCTILRYAVEVE